MAITFVGAGTPGVGTNPTCTVPAGYAAGDLLIITTTGTAAATAAGWTALPVVATSYPFTVLYKYASVTEASVTVTMASIYAKAVMVAYRGAYGFQAASITAFPGVSATTITTNPLYTTQTDDVVLSIYSSNIIANTWTADAATIARVNSPSTASYFGLLIADETQASIGASTPRTATSSPAVTGTALSIAIRIPSTTKTVLITTVGQSTFTIPSDFVSFISVEAVGTGGYGVAASPTRGGGGGGAYAKSIAVTGIVAGGTAYVQVGGNLYYANSYFTYGGGSNIPPTSPANGVLAQQGLAPANTFGAAGGSASTSIGTTTVSGGQGGSASGLVPGGGGGSGGPNGIGGAGGSVGSYTSGPGGGGAQGGSVGTEGSGTIGGVGGNGPGGSGGGVGAQSGVTLAGAGTAGTGGGGGGGIFTASYVQGGDGATGNMWVSSTIGTVAGPGGGGGAAGGSSTPTRGGYGGYCGGGGGGQAGTSGANTVGGDGIVVFTYSTLPAGSNFWPLF